MSGIGYELPGLAQGAECAEVPIVDELGSIWMQSDCRNFGHEGGALDVAMAAEAGRDAVEIAIVVAGMAAKLEGSGRGYSVQNLAEGLAVEIAGSGDANGSVGGENLSVANLGLTLEGFLQLAKKLHLKAANVIAMAEGEAPWLLERVANGADGAPLREVKQRPGYGWEEVRVFMGVEVGDVDAGALKFLHLSDGLALDIVFADGSAQQRLDEVDERWAKGLAIGTEQSGDAVGMRDGNPVGKDNMAAYAEGGVGVGYRDCVLEGWTGRHQRSGGDGPGAMKLSDGAVDAGSQAEVVCVDDEPGSHRS